MSADRQLPLEELPPPPLFKLVGEDDADVFTETEVGGAASSVGALFASRLLAEEFADSAGELGAAELSGLEARELGSWGAVEEYAASGMDYVLVISERGTGVFHASDVAEHASRKATELPFPLFFFTDERGEAPLVSVEQGGGEVMVAALFSSPERAEAFREAAVRLVLPPRLGTIEDREGLRRHALVARRAGADYFVVDPESGLTEAIPVDELVR